MRYDIYKYDIVAMRGDTTFPITLKFSNEDGAVVDISGINLTAEIKNDAGFSCIYKSQDSDGIDKVSAESLFSWDLEKRGSISIPPGTYEYGIRLEEDGGIKKTIMTGCVTVEKEKVSIS